MDNFYTATVYVKGAEVRAALIFHPMFFFFFVTPHFHRVGLAVVVVFLLSSGGRWRCRCTRIRQKLLFWMQVEVPICVALSCGAPGLLVVFLFCDPPPPPTEYYPCLLDYPPSKFPRGFVPTCFAFKVSMCLCPFYCFSQSVLLSLCLSAFVLSCLAFV